jgi:cysteine desulfurase/selenocysteine lyase
VSSVEWNNGFKNDVRALGEIAEKKDIYFVVDAAQHLGAAEFDCRKMKVDFMAASGHKWLVSPFGCGLFYASPEMVEEFEPDVIGHQNTKPGEFPNTLAYFESPESNPLVPFIPTKNAAKKFEVGGTSNYPGAIALAASIKFINSIGITNIAKRDLELGDYLIAGLQRLGVRIQSPLDHEHRAGITTFRLTKTPAEEKNFLLWLRERKIYTTLRFTSNVGGMRVSTHFYNSEEEIDRFLTATKEYAASHSQALIARA